MGSDIDKGTIYAEGGVGGAGTVNAANLNAHVDEARIKASFISSKSLKDPASLDDAFVIENSGVLYRETMQQVYDLINQTVQGLLPIGAVIDFAGVDAPAGWLLCFGQAVPRDVYDELFLAIGVSYGSGNGIDTFNVPDLRGRIAAGKDNMGGAPAGRLNNTYITAGGGATALGGNGGVQSHVMTVNEMPSHNHPASGTASTTTYAPMYTTAAEGGGTQGLDAGGSFGGRVFVTAAGFPTACSSSTSVTVGTSGAGAGAAQNNLQPTLIFNKIIRAQS